MRWQRRQESSSEQEYGNKIKNMLHNFELCSGLVPFHTPTHTHAHAGIYKCRQILRSLYVNLTA